MTELYFCKKPGHMKRECIKYLKWKTNNPVKFKVKVVIDVCENDHFCFHSGIAGRYECGQCYIDVIAHHTCVTVWRQTIL